MSEITGRDRTSLVAQDGAQASLYHPYYLLVDGRPLPLVLLEESEAGTTARKWFKCWLEQSTAEQLEFCGAHLFWVPPAREWVNNNG